MLFINLSEIKKGFVTARVHRLKKKWYHDKNAELTDLLLIGLLPPHFNKKNNNKKPQQGITKVFIKL